MAVNDVQAALITYSFIQQQLHHLAEQQKAFEKAMELATVQYETAPVYERLVALYQTFGGAGSLSMPRFKK